MGPQLEALAKAHDEVCLRIVDIGSWDSAVAEQHRVSRLPWLWLYEDGELVSKDTGAVLDRLNQLR